MKTLLHSFISAFAMYSKIPMPVKRLDDKGMKYAMCMFPLIGTFIGFVIMLWQSIAFKLDFNFIIKAAISVVIPVLITGGIHIDGLLDTVDALSSHQSRERKLEILKDSHTGAFAIIYGIVYFIVLFAVWTGLDTDAVIICCLGFTLSRALSALSVASFKLARNTGLVYAFADRSKKVAVRITSVIYIVLSVGAMFFFNPVVAAFAAAGAGLTFLFYRLMSYKQFGGITGDVAGFFSSLCELFIAVFALIGSKVFMLIAGTLG